MLNHVENSKYYCKKTSQFTTPERPPQLADLKQQISQKMILHCSTSLKCHSDILAMCCTANIIFCDICCFRYTSWLMSLKSLSFYNNYYMNTIIIITGSAVSLHCCKVHAKINRKMGNSAPA